MIKFKKLTENAKIPQRQTGGAAGFDLYSSINAWLEPRERCLLSTSIAVAIPEGYYGQVSPRSGLAIKNGIDVMAGVIDSDYRGEVNVELINHGSFPVNLNAGERIAQLVVIRIETDFEIVDDLDDTDRGSAGFGSTGAM